MSDVNHVILIGRLTRDATPPTGNGPTKFSLAVSRRVKHGDQWSEEASFIDCTYWHKTILPYLTKGKQIAVTGELVQERWEKDGQPRSALRVLALDIQLLGGGANTQSGENHAEQTSIDSSTRRGTATADSESFSDDEFTDDIPF